MFKMSKMVKILSVATLAAAVMVGGLSVLAFSRPAAAAGTAGQSSAALPAGSANNYGGGPGGFGGGPGGGPGFGVPGLGSDAGLAAAAKALNMTTADLTTQLRGGKTLADLATAAGVPLKTVTDAVAAANVAVTKAAIEAAVTAGTLTRDKADWLETGLDKGYWGGANGGIGFGPRGFGGGHDGRGGNGLAPNGTPAPSSTPTGK